MAIKTLRVFAEYTSTGFVPMPTAGGIDYGYTLASTFPSATPSSFQTDDPDIDVTVTAMTDFYVWIRINGTAWNPSYTRNVRVYPDSPDINSVVMNMIIATGPAGTSAYSQIVQTSNRLYFNGATTDSVYNSKFAGKTYINELNFGTAPQLATVATSGAYADLTGKPALSTVATSGSYADLSNKPSGTAPISYNSGTNSFQISVASASTNGYLTSTDWSTFNAKYLLPTGGTTAQYLRGDGTLATFPTTLDSTRLIFTGRNSTGSTLTKGTVVYINGVSGNTALLAKAIASGDSTSAQTLGVIENDIANNATGTVVLVGAVGNLDTSSFTEGVQLYLSGTVAGAFTSSKVLAPTHIVYVGIVTRAHPTLGTIEVKIQNGYELDEIHDVQISSPADKDILYRDSATSLWKHASIASVLGYTPYNASNPNNYIALTALSASAPLSYNNTTGAFTISQANTTTNGFLSSTDWNTFNSKQSALTIGNFTEVNSNVFMFPDGTTGKTIGNLSIQMIQAGASTNGYLSSTDWTTFNNKQATLPAASASVNGYLTSTDWSTFNSKQGAITLTTTGTSGAATFSANTLNIPQYQSVLTNPVTGTGTSNYIPKWTSSSAVGNSLIYDDSTTVFVNTTSGGFNTPRLLVNNGGTTSIGFQVNADNGGRVLRFQTSDFNNTNTGSALRINFGAGSGNTYSVINAYSAGESLTNNLILNQSGGDVAIGTANSSGYKLQVNGSINANSTISVAAWLALKNVSGSILGVGGINASEYTTLTLHTSGAERMRITSAGNVGIGTSSPLNKFTVLGVSSYQLSDANDIRLIINPTASGIQISSTYNTTGSYQPLIFSTSDTERMRITSGGNVSIGNTQANSRLTVSETTTGVPYREFNVDTSQSGLIRIFSYDRNSGGIPLSINEPGSNVLIGTMVNNGERLYVNGSIRATGNITANSDLVLKKNLKLVDNPIDKLNQLNGYLYQWKENDEYQYGVIAQEVEKILPHAVQTGANGIKGVAYNQLIPVMIEAIKELNSEVKLLKAK